VLIYILTFVFIATLFPPNCSLAQEIPFVEETYNLGFRVYRRSSEYYQLPNAFLDFHRKKAMPISAVISFQTNNREIISISDNDIRPEVTNFTLGRNHIPQKLLSYWSHYSPTLYQLKTKIDFGNRRMLDTVLIVGVVDYMVLKEKLLINNVQYALNAVIYKDSPQFTEIIEWKKHHVNTIVLNRIPSKELTKFCSEHGLYLIVDFRGQTEAIELFESKYDSIKSMPSIALYLFDDNNKELFEHKIEYKPTAYTTPLNVNIHNLSTISMDSLRMRCQPFKIQKIVTSDTTLKVTLSAYDGFENNWGELDIICSLNGKQELIKSEKRLEKQELIIPISFQEISEYDLKLIVNTPFSVFNIGDIVAVFKL
jgi:hypothetical protein